MNDGKLAFYFIFNFVFTIGSPKFCLFCWRVILYFADLDLGLVSVRAVAVCLEEKKSALLTSCCWTLKKGCSVVHAHLWLSEIFKMQKLTELTTPFRERTLKKCTPCRNVLFKVSMYTKALPGTCAFLRWNFRFLCVNSEKEFLFFPRSDFLIEIWRCERFL